MMAKGDTVYIYYLLSIKAFVFDVEVLDFKLRSSDEYLKIKQVI